MLLVHLCRWDWPAYSGVEFFKSNTLERLSKYEIKTLFKDYRRHSIWTHNSETSTSKCRLLHNFVFYPLFFLKKLFLHFIFLLTTTRQSITVYTENVRVNVLKLFGFKKKKKTEVDESGLRAVVSGNCIHRTRRRRRINASCSYYRGDNIIIMWRTSCDPPARWRRDENLIRLSLGPMPGDNPYL